MEDLHAANYQPLPGNVLVAGFYGTETGVQLDILVDTCRTLGDKFSDLLNQGRLETIPRPHWDRSEETSQFVTAAVDYETPDHKALIRLRWSFGPKNLAESFSDYARERCAVEIKNPNYVDAADQLDDWSVLAELEGQGQVKVKQDRYPIDQEDEAVKKYLLSKFVIPPKYFASDTERQGSLEEFQAFLDLVQCVVGPLTI